MSGHRGLLALVLAGVAFAVLATANAAGYRFGGSDQAFYVPAVTRAADSQAFPRDASLIDAQGALTLVDEVLAGAERLTGLTTEHLFFLSYLIALALTWAGLVAIGSHVYASPWTIAALGAAFTLRHRITMTATNTFEPYFHPRMVAFALGLLAVAAVLRRRLWVAVAVIGIAGIVHTTTALWFAMLVGVAIGILDRRFRTVVVAGSVGALVVLAWAALAGPLRNPEAVMDEVWLNAVSTKDFLFPDDWPLWAWVANFGTLALLWAAHLVRRRRGTATPEDGALVWGATALVVLFVLTLPLVFARVALAVEFQVSRVFWLVDVFAAIYGLAALAETRLGGRPLAVTLAAVLVTVSVSRGLYVGVLEHPERALFAISTPPSPWEDAMQWLSRQPVNTHVLADQGHSWKFGTSVRVSAGRDVFLEEVKDRAVAIYSRDVASRVIERTMAVGDFKDLTAERAQALAARYDLDVLITDADLPLPVAYRNSQFRIYRIRPDDASQ